MDYTVTPLKNFGVAISGIDMRDVRDNEISILKSFILNNQLLVLRGQVLTEEELVNITALFGEPPEPILVPDIADHLGFILSDPDRGIFAQVDRPSIRWLTSGANLVAERVIFCNTDGAVLFGLSDVGLDSNHSIRSGAVCIKNGEGVAGPRNDVWHSDMSYVQTPPAYTFLYAKQVPENGLGDTLFANMHLAFCSLPKSFQDLLADVYAVHSSHSYALHSSGTYMPPTAIRVPDVVHQVVMTQKDGGRKFLYVNPYYVRNLVEFSELESDAILTSLYSVSTQSEFIYRHKWERNDLIIWDNHALMHYGIRDYSINDIREIYRTVACYRQP